MDSFNIACTFLYHSLVTNVIFYTSIIMNMPLLPFRALETDKFTDYDIKIQINGWCSTSL